jgi:hypothetical protein
MILVVVWFAFGTAVLIDFLFGKQWLTLVAFGTAALVTLVGWPIYLWQIIRMLAASRLILDGPELVVRGSSWRGLREWRIDRNHLERVELGEVANVLVRGLQMISFISTNSTEIHPADRIRAAALVFVHSGGRKIFIRLAAKVFDEKELVPFMLELKKAGVTIVSNYGDFAFPMIEHLVIKDIQTIEQYIGAKVASGQFRE